MIVVLTFDHPHRKTQDLILKLLAHGIKPAIVATEWVDKPGFVPIIPHRPGNAMPIELSVMAKNLNLELRITTKENLFETLTDLENIEAILLATGNIIEERIVKKYKVINSHPGYLPLIKGLDALKWAILYKEPIGVTTHYVNEQIDGGVIIERRLLKINYEDTFHNVAHRQYEMEVDMLISALFVNSENVEIGESKFETFRRMPHRLEPRMLEQFDQLRRESEINSKFEK